MNTQTRPAGSIFTFARGITGRCIFSTAEAVVIWPRSEIYPRYATRETPSRGVRQKSWKGERLYAIDVTRAEDRKLALISIFFFFVHFVTLRYCAFCDVQTEVPYNAKYNQGIAEN